MQYQSLHIAWVRRLWPAYQRACIGIAPHRQPPVLQAEEGPLCQGQQQHENGQDVQGTPSPCIDPVGFCVHLAHTPALNLFQHHTAT